MDSMYINEKEKKIKRQHIYSQRTNPKLIIIIKNNAQDMNSM